MRGTKQRNLMGFEPGTSGKATTSNHLGHGVRDCRVNARGAAQPSEFLRFGRIPFFRTERRSWVRPALKQKPHAGGVSGIASLGQQGPTHEVAFLSIQPRVQQKLQTVRVIGTLSPFMK